MSLSSHIPDLDPLDARDPRKYDYDANATQHYDWTIFDNRNPNATLKRNSWNLPEENREVASEFAIANGMVTPQYEGTTAIFTTQIAALNALCDHIDTHGIPIKWISTCENGTIRDQELKWSMPDDQDDIISYYQLFLDDIVRGFAQSARISRFYNNSNIVDSNKWNREIVASLPYNELFHEIYKEVGTQFKTGREYNNNLRKNLGNLVVLIKESIDMSYKKTTKTKEHNLI